MINMAGRPKKEIPMEDNPDDSEGDFLDEEDSQTGEDALDEGEDIIQDPIPARAPPKRTTPPIAAKPPIEQQPKPVQAKPTAVKPIEDAAFQKYFEDVMKKLPFYSIGRVAIIAHHNGTNWLILHDKLDRPFQMLQIDDTDLKHHKDMMNQVKF